ncbi:MAG: saccharopine dehydrogenase NADP-binding domain-containing protein [Bacteroidota bacterium]|nr:saccharopine dehydrogenase NADP-binding domain-containing protein [Bacteroidota bacterium]
MTNASFLLYGANGYSGKLIARFAARYQVSPVLAGRNAAALKQLSRETGYPFRVADINDAAQLRTIMRDVQLVVNAAGPFDRTARQLIEACLDLKKHYIDLNGDTAVFEMIRAYHHQALEAGIMILPGAGFDVVPTDCLALFLAQQMPEASSLEIAFAIKGSSLSHGTAITTAERLGLPGAIRSDGRITGEPVGKRGMEVEFTPWKEKAFVMSIPWGDISTAWYSTHIPNIITYTAVTRTTWWFLKGQVLFNWLLCTKFMRRKITGLIHQRIDGPGDLQRAKAVSLIRATVSNRAGNKLTAFLRCPEAYSLTADASLLITQKVLRGIHRAGYQTPASAYGSELVMEIKDVERIQVQTTHS